jgi:hypothetical protein
MRPRRQWSWCNRLFFDNLCFSTARPRREHSVQVQPSGPRELCLDRAFAEGRRWKRHIGSSLSRRIIGVVSLCAWIVWASLAVLIGRIGAVVVRHRRFWSETPRSERLVMRDDNDRPGGQSPLISIGFLLDRDWSRSDRGTGHPPDRWSTQPPSMAKRQTSAAYCRYLVR